MDTSMKTITAFITIFMLMAAPTERTDDIYQYELNLINGEKISLEDFEGDVLLIVNTASECGHTPQYEGLQKLYEEYSERGFKILGFPANNFGGQEPGTDEEIAQFCEMNFGVTFPLFSKVSVKGEDQHPLFEYLTNLENQDFTGEISWNFEKFLIDRNGNLIRRFKTNVTPDSDELLNAVTGLL
jgi:glutathione peroxidase